MRLIRGLTFIAVSAHDVHNEVAWFRPSAKASMRKWYIELPDIFSCFMPALKTLFSPNVTEAIGTAFPFEGRVSLCHDTESFPSR